MPIDRLTPRGPGAKLTAGAMHLLFRLLVASVLLPSAVLAKAPETGEGVEPLRPSIRARRAPPAEAGKPPVFAASSGVDCRSRREHLERHLEFKRQKMVWNLLRISGVGASYGLEACRAAEKAFQKAAELSDGKVALRAFELASAQAFRKASSCRSAFEKLYTSDCGGAFEPACRAAESERRELAYLDGQNARFAKDLEARQERLAQLAKCKDPKREPHVQGRPDDGSDSGGRPAKAAAFASIGPNVVVPAKVAPGVPGAGRSLDRGSSPPPAAAPPPHSGWWDRLKDGVGELAKKAAGANVKAGKDLLDAAKGLWDRLFGKKPKEPERKRVEPEQYLVSDSVDVATAQVELKEQKSHAHDFQGAKVEAEVWDASYSDGTSIEIVGPKEYSDGRSNYSVKQAADAVRYLPNSSRAVVERVQMNPITNPDDEYWAKEYNNPGFRSYMTAGAAGVITIYPAEDGEMLVSEGHMRVSLIHETGHVWSFRTWGDSTERGKWKNWKKAGDKDNTWVSGYAKSSPAEDVAETYAAYWSTKTKPKHETYRKAVPNRFAMLDRESK